MREIKQKKKRNVKRNKRAWLGRHEPWGTKVYILESEHQETLRSTARKQQKMAPATEVRRGEWDEEQGEEGETGRREGQDGLKHGPIERGREGGGESEKWRKNVKWLTFPLPLSFVRHPSLLDDAIHSEWELKLLPWKWNLLIQVLIFLAVFYWKTPNQYFTNYFDIP